MASPRLRIFISSPGDVGLEREICARVIERLRGKFGSHFELSSVHWEEQPFRATASFQAQIDPPSQCDIVVCILWSRLGTPLSDDFRRPDGSRYDSGTEWEFEDAVRAYRERGVPDLLVYRRKQVPEVSLKDEAVIAERQAQYRALQAFINKWFFNEDGTFKAASKSYRRVDEFEHQIESDLNRLLLERLEKRGQSEEDLRPTVHWPQGSPFLGLNAFGVEHAPVFHGRTRAIGAIREALVQRAAAGCAAVVVFGMSGCGKSSLVRAGVVATVTRPGVVEGVGPFRWCEFRPSDAPGDLTRGLASAVLSDGCLPALRDMGVDAGKLGAMLATNPEHAAMPIGMALSRVAENDTQYNAPGRPASPRLVLVVDQLEELFTLATITPDQRRAFAAALLALAQSGHAWVLATMRSDFYHRCVELPELAALKEGAGQFDLPPPSFDEVGQAIAYPARAAALRFEHDGATGRRLDAVLHEAAGQTPESLPLLSFVLDELYRARTNSGLLTFAAYDALGGMEGAIASRAESVFASQPPETRDELRPLVRTLATVEGEGDVVVSRRVPLAQAGATAGRRAMLDAMVAARLLVADRAEDGTPVVRVTHEALLDRWPRVAAWLAEDREFLRVRARVAEAAARWWAEGRRPDRLLPPGKPLAEAEAMVAHRAGELDPGTAEYVASSSAALRRRRRRRAAAAVLIASGVTAAALISYKEWDDGRTAKLVADSQKKAAARETALGLELQAKNRELNARNELKAKELAYDKLMSNGSFDLVGRQYKLAYEKLKQATDIAGTIADGPGVEQTAWAQKYSEALTKLAEAEFGLGRFDDGKKTLQRRPALINGKPVVRPDSGEIQTGSGIALNEHHITAVRLHLELAIANEHLKALLKQNQILKEAMNLKQRGSSIPAVAKAAAKPAEPVAKKVTDAIRTESINRMLGVIAMAEMVVTKTGEASDRNVLDLAYSLFAKDIASSLQAPAEALKVVERRIAFDRRQVEELEPKVAPSERERGLSDDRLRDQLADAWLSLFSAYRLYAEIHITAGDLPAALADYNRAIETIERAELTPSKRSEAAEKAAETRFLAAGLMRSRQEEASATRELNAGVGLLISDAEAAVREARRRQVDRVVTAAEQQAKFGERDAARASYQKAVALMTALADETRDIADRSKLLELYVGHANLLAAQDDLPAARAAYLAALAERTRRASAFKDADALEVVAGLHGRFGRFLEARKDVPGALEQYARAVEGYRKLVGPGGRRGLSRATDDLYRSWTLLLKKQKDPALDRVSAERVKFLGEWRDALAKSADSPGLVDEWRTLADDFAHAGDRPEAVRAHGQSTRVGERLATSSGDAEKRRAVSLSYFQLGAKCLDLGDPKAADEALTRAREANATAGEPVNNPGWTLALLAESARVKLELPDRASALDLARQALAWSAPPSDASTLNRSASTKALSYRILSSVLYTLDEKAGARDAANRAVATAQAFLDADRGNKNAVLSLARAYEHRGGVEWEEKNYPAAEADYLKVLDVCQGVPRAVKAAGKPTAIVPATSAAPAPPPVGQEVEELALLGRVCSSLGSVRNELKKDPGAIEAYERSIAIYTRLADADPTGAEWYLKLGDVYHWLARFQFSRRDYPLAVRALKGQAKALEQALVNANTAAIAKDLSDMYINLSWYTLWARMPADTEAAARRGMELTPPENPNTAMLAANLAHALLFQNRWDEAAAVYRKFRTAKVGEKRTFREAALEDLRDFRKDGLTHPDLDRAQKLLEETDAAPKT